MGFWDKVKSIFGGTATPKPEDVPFAPTAATDSSGATQSQAQKDKYALGELSSLSADELRAQAASTGWWFSPWRWRRDVIPPLADPHTARVDRSMVLRGVVTEDELKKLHDVGDEWLRLKDAKLAGRIVGELKGDAAIQALHDARAARKAELRAQSAARKAERRAQIEARKQHDIVFLGRGVSTSLGDRASNVARLEARGLPVLHTPGDVARALDLTISQLRGLCFHSEATPRAHYVQFDV